MTTPEKDETESVALGAASPVRLEACPHCHEGVNSSDHGGTDRCFHCDRCAYIGCMWTDKEKREMLAALPVPATGPSLRALIDQWRSDASECYEDEASNAFRQCADQLEAALAAGSAPSVITKHEDRKT
jgi:hypothetical protein